MGAYNLGKFNVKKRGNISLTANSDINFSASIDKVLLQKEVQKVEAVINYEAEAKGMIEKRFNEKLNLQINYYATALSTSILSIENIISEINYNAEAVSSLLGEEYIEIKGFVLKPGQEIEINTCDLTATINGENAIHLLTEDGDFFDFLPGENDIKIDAAGAESVSIDTYWKDRWL